VKRPKPPGVTVSGLLFSWFDARRTAWDKRYLRETSTRGQSLNVQLFADDQGYGCWAQLSRSTGRRSGEMRLIQIGDRASWESALKAAMAPLRRDMGDRFWRRFWTGGSK
jgi:hypothetical protein